VILKVLHFATGIAHGHYSYVVFAKMCVSDIGTGCFKLEINCFCKIFISRYK